MRKILTIVLSMLLLSTAFAGCAEPNNSQRNLILWHSMADEAGAQLQSFVDEFNQSIGAQLGITVESVFQGSYADATTQLRIILQSGQYDQLPDVMQIDATGITDFMATEFAFTVDDALARGWEYDLSQILKIPLTAWNFGGVQLGMPFNSSTTVMYYNRTILEAAGITDIPTTFGEIIEVASLLPNTNPAGRELSAFAQIPSTPLLANWIGQIPGQGGVNASYIVNNRNGRDAMATHLVSDSEGTLELFLGAWKNMYDSGALLNQSDGLREMFLAEQLVFFTGSTSMMASLLTQIDGRFELGCTYFPRIHENANFGATVSGAAMFMFDKGDEDVLFAAWELLKHLASPDIQARFSVATGYFPINRYSYDIELYLDYLTRYPQMEVGIRQVNITSPDMAGVIVGPSRDFFLEIQNQVSNMLSSGTNPANAAESMAAALNSLLEQYVIANPQ